MGTRDPKLGPHVRIRIIKNDTSSTLVNTMWTALSSHWQEYLMEAALLGTFMISACTFGAVLEHPSSPIRMAVNQPLLRRTLMGVCMGLTAVSLIYSPWGQQSGAHMNPATTLTFLRLGKVAPWDAFFYVIAQFAGAVAGVWVVNRFLATLLRHPSVNFVSTVPGRFGTGWAWLAECTIAFGMMFMVLNVTNTTSLAPYVGWMAGALVALYITIEAPISGMSMNAARTFGSAVFARSWRGLWIYLTAPLCGMLLASTVYAALPNDPKVHCAKINHCTTRRCIFVCGFGNTK